MVGLLDRPSNLSFLFNFPLLLFLVNSFQFTFQSVYQNFHSCSNSFNFQELLFCSLNVTFKKCILFFKDAVSHLSGCISSSFFMLFSLHNLFPLFTPQFVCLGLCLSY